MKHMWTVLSQLFPILGPGKIIFQFCKNEAFNKKDQGFCLITMFGFWLLTTLYRFEKLIHLQSEN